MSEFTFDTTQKEPNSNLYQWQKASQRLFFKFFSLS